MFDEAERISKDRTDTRRLLVREGRVVPLVGASLTYDLIFAIGEENLAEAWAEALGLHGQGWGSIARVAEHEYFRTGDDSRVKADYLLFLKRLLLARAKENPEVDQDPVEDLIASMDERTFTEIAENLGYPKIDDPHRDPLVLLANLPLLVYVTTSFHSLLQNALQRSGKNPRTVVCLWNEAARYFVKAEHQLDDAYSPSVETPVVFHVYGHEEYPESLVLSEDNYLSWLESVAQGRGRNTSDPIPALVRAGLYEYQLLYLGFKSDALEFRVLQMELDSSSRRTGTLFVAKAPEQETIRQYVLEYLQSRDLDGYLGDLIGFLNTLQEAQE